VPSRRKRPKIVISGYFGFDNNGDEAILLAMIHCLKTLRPDARIIVLSGEPERTRELYGVEAIDRWSPAAVSKALLRTTLFISGGGSLIQDVTSVKSADYYLSVIWLATLLAKKTMVYCQGVGPLANAKIRRKTAKVLNHCDVLTVRDAQSAKLLKTLGVEKEIQEACDPVMALSYEDVDREEVREYLQEMNILDSTGRKRKPLLLVTLRCWEDNRHFAPIAELLDMQARGDWDVLLAPAQFPADMEAIDKVGNLMRERLYCLGKNLTARQYMALTSYADKVFSMRLHGLIFAMAMGVPMLALSYDPKVEAFMEQVDLDRYCLPFDAFDWETAAFLLEEMETMPLDALHKQEERRRELHELAWDTARRAVEMLERI